MNFIFSNELLKEQKRFFVYYSCKFYSFLCKITLGIFYSEKNFEDKKEIYKKYLGDDYQIEKNTKFSLIISNHVSWSVIKFLIFYL